MISITRLDSDVSENDDEFMDPTTFFEVDCDSRSDNAGFQSPRQLHERKITFFEQCVLGIGPRKEDPNTKRRTSSLEPLDTTTTESTTNDAFSPSELSAQDHAFELRALKKTLHDHADPHQFPFIFVIPLRKWDGSLNYQWDSAIMQRGCGATVGALKKLFTDPMNYDTVYMGTIPEYMKGQEFTMKAGEADDEDGPYRMPLRGQFVSLRDGAISTDEKALDCGIELDFPNIIDRTTKVLAYWSEITGQWCHLPLRHFDKVVLHQKRCIANVFDIHE